MTVTKQIESVLVSFGQLLEAAPRRTPTVVLKVTDETDAYWQLQNGTLTRIASLGRTQNSTLELTAAAFVAWYRGDLHLQEAFLDGLARASGNWKEVLEASVLLEELRMHTQTASSLLN